MIDMLYDSPAFVVTHTVANDEEINLAMASDRQIPWVRHIFEIVDKRTMGDAPAKEVVLDGAWAEVFLELTKEWQRDPPEEAFVEAVLDGYVQLAQIPLVIH